MAQRLAEKVVLIGWDGADWQIIKPLLDAGQMPALQSLIENGVMGNFASMHPMISPMLWTSMATGMPPHRHGIHGFTEPDPNSESGIRLAGSTSRKCKAFWNILSQSDILNHVVGWFAGHPAEPIDGVVVSELFAKADKRLEEGWPVPEGSVYPSELVQDLEQVRVHPMQISLEQIEFLVPTVKEIDQTRDQNPQTIATQLAECATNQAVATWILQNEDWDMLSVYFNTIDHLCHGFMYFHPPRMDHIPESLFQTYQHVVNNTYRFHDLMLNRIMKLAGPETTFIICSDHGYQTGHRRPMLTPQEPAGPTVWHRPYGMFVMSGPNTRKDELIFGGRIIDLAPTVLTLFGLPVGEDMIGKPLVQAFRQPVEVKTIPSWEEVDGDSGMHDGHVLTDPASEKAAFEQFVALGYVEPASDDKQSAMNRTSDELDYNLARSFMAVGRHADAAKLLEKVHANQPERLTVAYELADCYQMLKRYDDCRRLVDHIAGGSCHNPGMENRNLKVIPQVDYLYGILALNNEEPEKAMEHLLRAESKVGQFIGLHKSLGNAYIQLQRWEDAERAFIKALETDSDDAEALHGLAIVALEAGQPADAIELALQSLEVLFHQPRVHYHLGLACMRTGNLDRAKQAFEVSLDMRPDRSDVKRELANVNRALHINGVSR